MLSDSEPLVPANGPIAGSLAVMRAHDPPTESHMRRVAELTYTLALRCGYDVRDARRFGRAGLMHDIGKLFTPRGILQLPRALSRRQWGIIHQHVIEGVEVVKSLGETDIVEIVLAHHERLDGSGYPRGRSPNEGARVVAIADAFDAMTVGRVYSEACAPDEALERLDGARFDEAIVATLREVVALRDTTSHYDQKRTAIP